jgi:hypothetical protein
MHRLALPPPTITVAGRPLASSVELWAGCHGPHQLAFSAVIAELGLRVDTSCLGRPGGPLQVAHLIAAPGRSVCLRTELADPAVCCIRDTRGILLYLHVHELADVLRQSLAGPLAIDVPALAVARVTLA